MNDDTEEKDLSRGPEMNMGNGKVIECTVKSLDLRRLLESHERTSGNDYLYEFCHAYPIPEVKNATGNLTPEEACLADQMWLIGRSYAASPERYTYSKTKPKEKEEYLGSEGYESFFQDVARMFLRNKCHDKNKPVAYFRGKQCEFKFEDMNDNRLKQFNNEYAKISKEYEKDSKENNSANKTEKTGIDNLLLKVSKACEALRGFQSPQGDIRLHAICLSGESGRIDNCHDLDDSGVLSSFNEAWSYAKLTSQYVIRFAKQLNAARTLRDAAIIYHSLETLKETPDNRSEDIAEIADWAYSICNGAPSISISFCSKFLHFHFPQLFFIYDSISSERAKAGNLSKGPFDFALKKNVKKGEDNVGQPSRVIREWIKENPKSDSKNNDESTKSNKKYDDKLMLYQEHVFNELVISYAIFRYLLDASDKDSEERRKAKEGLWEHLKDYTSSQDTCREIPCGPPHCLSITRLVDELVTNSSPENLEEAKETD